MQNTTSECSCPAATAARGASPVGALTITDGIILLSLLLVACAGILHMWSLQRAQSDKALTGCVETIRIELPALRDQMTSLRGSHLKISKLHHQAVGVLDGLRHTSKEPARRHAVEADQ